MQYNKLFINNEWIDGDSGQFIDVLNVGTKEVMAQVPRGNKVDVDRAVAAARAAQPGWQATPAQKRADIVQKALDLMKDMTEEITEIEIDELGQPAEWTRMTHVFRNWARIESFIEVARHFEYERPSSPQSTIVYEAVGVVGCLTPWNYPLGQVVQKIIPAILGGNTVILKPSQHTPLTVYFMAEAFLKAGLPAGVLNIVTGAGSEVGDHLTVHPDIDMISFTGSTVAGREVGRQSLSTIKKIALEMGGKSPAVLLPKADIEQYLPIVASSCFANSGQTCVAYTRLLVQEEDLEAVCQKMTELAKEWKAGLPRATDSKLGPLINHKAYEKVRSYIQSGLDEGATLVVGDVPAADSKDDVVQPVVFSNVLPDNKICQEEIFGPVLCIQTYKDLEEAVRLANNTAYGLGAAVFGDLETAQQIARQIRAGQVFINKGVRDIMAPFGGYKESGIGREGGPIGFEEFLEVKGIFND